MAEPMTYALIAQALFRTVATKCLPPGLIHHSDYSSQYCAHAYQNVLRQFSMPSSMSRRAIAGTIHRWKVAGGSLKTELVHHQQFINREHAK